MSSLEAFAREKLAALEARGQRRGLRTTSRLPQGRVVRGARELVDFSSNDALGLSQHPAVVDAARAALARYGTGAGASRLVTGNHPLFATLEDKLAAAKGAHGAVVVSSGYLANLGVIPAVVGAGDLIVIDALAHACLFAGARLSGARVVEVPHNDLDAVATALHARDGGRALVVTESVFSMDGDRAPLRALAEVCRATDAWLLVDDAHGFLVSPDQPTTCAVATIVTGTLSKATASVGGYIAGPRALVDLLMSRARPLVYSTGLPPSVVAAAAAALDVAEREGRALQAAPRERAARFCAALGLPPPASHIVPLLVGEESAALRAMALLEEEGFLAVAIRPPTVPVGTSRLRLSFSAAHTIDDVDALAAAVRRVLPGLAP